MKYFIFLVLCYLIVISCVTDNNPVSIENFGYDILIKPTGESGNGFVEFKFSNSTNTAQWFWGYSHNFPLYNVQVKNDTGWVNTGGWCGTGMEYQCFSPYESIIINVYKPSTFTPWRVGINTSTDSLKNGEYSWSKIQN